MKNRQKHKTTDRDGIETQGGVQMGVYGCGWMGRSVVGRANTKPGIGGGSVGLTRAQKVRHGRGNFPKNTYLMWGGMEGRVWSWMDAGWCR